MAANAFRLRRSLAITSSILNHQRHFSSVLSSVAAPPSFSPSTVLQNPSLFDVTQSKPNSLSFQFMSSRAISSRPRYNNNNMDDDQISPDAILFEGCDYNHWLITMDFPKDPKPSPEEMVETYVQTAAKVLGSVEEAKKKIYACSTTTYNGFQVEVSEEVSEQFKGLPGVVFVLPDSYIDPVNKEYGGDKYINGTIIPRPPPVQYGRQGGRYNDRNRDYNRPPRGRMEQNSPRQQSYGDHMPMNNAPGGQGNYQGDIRGPMPSYQANYNEGEGRNFNPTPRRDPGNYAHPEQRDFRGEGRNFSPPPVGNYSQGGGGSFGQQRGGQLGQGGGGSYRQGPGGQYGQGRGGQYGQGGGGSYGQGTGGQYGQADGGNYGHGTGGQYGQGGSGNYGQGTGGQYGQGGGGDYRQGTGGQYGQGAGGNYGQGTGGLYGQPDSGNYGQGTGGLCGQPGSGNYGQGTGGSYGQGTGGQYGQGGDRGYGQGELRNFGQGVGGAYGPQIVSGDSRTSSQYYGENAKFPQMEQRNNIQRQQGNYEVIEEAETIKER